MIFPVRRSICSLLLLCVGLFTAGSLRAQNEAALTFTGGNNTPLTLRLAAPVIYTITTAGTNGPVFVFQDLANEALGYQPAVSGTIA